MVFDGETFPAECGMVVHYCCMLTAPAFFFIPSVLIYINAIRGRYKQANWFDRVVFWLMLLLPLPMLVFCCYIWFRYLTVVVATCVYHLNEYFGLHLNGFFGS